MVEGLNPHTLIESLFLCSDAFIHGLHREADAVGEVTKDFFNVDHPHPGVSHKIEAQVSSAMSFSPRISHDASFLDFGMSITTFFSLLSFLLLIFGGLFSLILLRWRRGARGLRRSVSWCFNHIRRWVCCKGWKRRCGCWFCFDHSIRLRHPWWPRTFLYRV